MVCEQALAYSKNHRIESVVLPDQMAVVLGAARNFAVWRCGDAVELSDAELVIQFGKAVRAYRGEHVIDAVNTAIVADKHGVVAAAVELRVRHHDVLIGVGRFR